eukprot:1160641-Pelagomonas_calceolata.AAC.4
MHLCPCIHVTGQDVQSVLCVLYFSAAAAAAAAAAAVVNTPGLQGSICCWPPQREQSAYEHKGRAGQPLSHHFFI